MNLTQDIHRAVRHINAQISVKESSKKKSEKEIEDIVKKVKKDLDNETYNFKSATATILSRGNKKRLVKRFDNEFSTENILCQCIKQILDKEFRVKYPNRNKISKSLFNTIGVIAHMDDFTIIRFDFKDYFNSVSSSYVFHKILKQHLRYRFEIDLLKKYTEETKYAYAGLKPSNAIAEIIAKSFDNEILMKFSEKGLLYFERYIDDGIIILNEYVSKNDCNDIINHAVRKIFHNKEVNVTTKCKTTINTSKFKYISKREMDENEKCDIDFLGYKFILYNNNGKIIIEYGVTAEKQKKYQKRVENIVKLYCEQKIDGNINSDYGNLELLRHRILAFTSRQVYVTKKYKSDIWKVKGFISNYGELRYILGTPHLEKETEYFLQETIDEVFRSLNIEKMPYFFNGDGKKAYSLYFNMEKNRTLLFCQNIGYSEDALIKLCRKIGIATEDSTGVKRGYGTLVRDYLIKTKVGY